MRAGTKCPSGSAGEKGNLRESYCNCPKRAQVENYVHGTRRAAKRNLSPRQILPLTGVPLEPNMDKVCGTTKSF
jgi:hypothetical protein